MERKGFVIPDFIYDTFNLSLLEADKDNDQSNDYYTIEELKVLVSDKFKKEGFEIPDEITDYWSALHKEK